MPPNDGPLLWEASQGRVRPPKQQPSEIEASGDGRGAGPAAPKMLPKELASQKKLGRGGQLPNALNLIMGMYPPAQKHVGERLPSHYLIALTLPFHTPLNLPKRAEEKLSIQPSPAQISCSSKICVTKARDFLMRPTKMAYPVAAPVIFKTKSFN